MHKRVLAAVVVSLGLLLAGISAGAQSSSAKSDAQAAGQQSNSAARNAGKATEKTTEKGADKVTGKIDVNSASKQELEELPGIGPVTADKIIAGRPYNTKRDLLTRKIVSQKEYDAIKDKLVAHRATAKK